MEQLNEEKKVIKPLKDNPTLVEAMQEINEIMCDSGIDEEALAKAEPALNVLSTIYGISRHEALILSAIVENAVWGSANDKDLAGFFKCTNVQMLTYIPVIESLAEKGYIRSYDSRRNGNYYQLSKAFRKSLRDNVPFVRPSLSNLDLHGFLSVYSELEDERHNDQLDYKIFYSELVRLVQGNLHLPLCKFLAKDVGLEEIREPAVIFILRACVMAELYKECKILKTECSLLFKNKYDTDSMTIALGWLSNTKNPKQVFEPAISSSESLADYNFLRLTSKFCKRYLQGLDLEKSRLGDEVAGDIIYPDKIVEKTLFYNAKEVERVSELAKLLKPRNLKRIQERLKEYGYRSGFACLFYGAPGTGKTETAMQLARATGRSVMPVDLSQVRDKYVGESEKRTKAIFDEYRRAMKRSEETPILLLNEADGLFSKRYISVEHQAQKMENTMQNILLQEMETFEGILIATTNLTCNLDSAFERRFLYKIEFHKPSVEARQSIWRTMIHDITPSEAQTMAEEFEFSGGEIENIARKYVIDTILHNTKTDVNALRQMCRDERLSKSDDRKRIGF